MRLELSRSYKKKSALSFFVIPSLILKVGLKYIICLLFFYVVHLKRYGYVRVAMELYQIKIGKAQDYTSGIGGAAHMPFQKILKAKIS